MLGDYHTIPTGYRDDGVWRVGVLLEQARLCSRRHLPNNEEILQCKVGMTLERITERS